MTSATEGRPIAAGLAYFATVFMVGFLLGVPRTLVVEPMLGRLLAVVLELPFILCAAWLLCRRFTVVFRVSPRLPARLTMGGVALALLLLAELGLSLGLQQNSFSEHLQNYRTPAGFTGLAGQLAFAAFPLVTRRQA